MTEAVLLIGTRKGLFVARSRNGRSDWDLDLARFAMNFNNAVYAVGVDNRRPVPRLFASVTSEHWGPGLAYSDDLGVTWTEPPRSPVAFPEFTGTSLERVWQIQPGNSAEPGVIYAGTQPSALFRSEDGGVSFDIVRSLWDHPHREQWGAGYGGQAIHTIIPHPSQPDRVLVAMSTGGVYRTGDRGASWAPANQGIKVNFSPEEYPEYGQCVHKVAADPADPDRLYLQNHGGVYRSDDWGGQWVPIASGLPADFGFPVLAHPRRAGTLYLFPLQADARRAPPEGRCHPYRSDDGGGSWYPLHKGLPEEGFWVGVLRDALCTDGADPAGIYFGSRGGEVFASQDEGESWSQIAGHLPDVLSVRAAIVP